MSTLAGLWLPGATLGAPALLLAGLAASPHCALMCGAIATLGPRGAPAGGTLQLQAGRVIGYGALGALAGGSGQFLLGLLPVVSAGPILQVLAALVALLFAWRLFRQPLQPACCHPASSHRLPPLLRGLLWAAMPCSILYAVLTLAMLSGSAPGGALLAAAFGLGGLPLLALLGAIGLSPPGGRVAQRAAALWLAVLGSATLLTVAFAHGGSVADCLALR